MATKKKHYVPRTQIVCTLGPASSSESTLRKMLREGMDIVRLNFSHGNLANHVTRIERVRALNKKYRRHIRILGDLAGPRIRIGYLADHKPVLLEKNRKVSLVREGQDGARRIPFDYAGSYDDLHGAESAFLDDGNIILRITGLAQDRVDTRVVVGGLLKERKAINIPGADLRFPPLSEKDARDIEFAVAQQLDYLAVSFARNSADVQVVRDAIGDRMPQGRIIAKIENQQGIDHLEEIMDVSDGIMVARGDMGVCVPIYEVPLIQKHILRRCRARRRFCITATQMLEHMVEYPTPTRAEVTDIANAVIDGTHAVMLSAETAVGRFPVESVRMMNQIIRHTELNRH
jgi:pyruvate kinase